MNFWNGAWTANTKRCFTGRFGTPKTTSRRAPHALLLHVESLPLHPQSDDADLREAYEVDKLKALKNALKYASKFVKKDREKDYVPSEQEFIEELRKETLVAAETEINGKYTKAKGYHKYLTALDEEDPGAWLMFGGLLDVEGVVAMLRFAGKRPKPHPRPARSWFDRRPK